MGNFYTSFTVRGASHDDVVRAVKGRTCVVSPTTNSYTVIWDAECEGQDQTIIDRLGKEITSRLACPVLAVLNHDDDILWYGLYSQGNKIDEYNSAPGYFEGSDAPPSGGNVELLTETISPGVSHEIIKRVLHRKEYVFAYERHSELLDTLGMPAFAASVGYKYINKGELPQGLTRADLTFTG